MLAAVHDLWITLARNPHIGLYLTLGWVGYLVWVGGWIVLQKREPVATLSWLLGLAALPYLGFLV
jgi:cardiolipin synthase